MPAILIWWRHSLIFEIRMAVNSLPSRLWIQRVCDTCCHSNVLDICYSVTVVYAPQFSVTHEDLW